ncbi:TPA: DUF4760 domain-containing protein [Mannheimia haemolytica]
MDKIDKAVKYLKRGKLGLYRLGLISLIAYLYFKETSFSIEAMAKFLQEWSSLGQLLVISLTAFIAMCTMISARKTSKEKATLDVVLSDYKDSDLVEASRTIFDIVRKDSNHLYTVFQNKKGEYSKERNSLLLVVNRYEFYASAINHGILDERLFKRSHCSNFIKLWDAVSPTVMSIRDKERKETLFKDLEILVLRWKSKPLSVDDL